MFKPKLPQQEQGFTLVEVLVAILITTLFVAVSMQAMVLAAVFKTRAQQYAEATTWIQEDLENVKYRASRYKPDPKSDTECAPDNVVRGYADSFRDDELFKKDSPTLLKTTLPNGSYPEVFDKNSSRTKQKFRLTRITNPVNDIPYNKLQIRYDVSPTSNISSLTSNATSGTSLINVASINSFAVNDNLQIGSDFGIYRISKIDGNTLTITPTLATSQSQNALVQESIATFYTEVIPDAAFQCP